MRRAILWLDSLNGDDWGEALIAAMAVGCVCFGVTVFAAMFRHGRVVDLQIDGALRWSDLWWGLAAPTVAVGALVLVIWLWCVCWGAAVDWAKRQPHPIAKTMAKAALPQPAPIDPFLQQALREVENIAPEREVAA